MAIDQSAGVCAVRYDYERYLNVNSTIIHDKMLDYLPESNWIAWIHKCKIVSIRTHKSGLISPS